MIAIDASRTVVSFRGGRQYRSDALLANALHFASDLAGTLAVLAGLVAAALGFPEGDAIAALFVAGLVVVAAGRLLRRNVDVLMDRAPVDAEETARRAIAALEPPVELRRLRVRAAGGAHFVDVVIGIAPGAAVGQGHAAADRVEEAVRESLPDATSSSTWSRATRTPRCASARSPQRSAFRAFGSSTTWRCSTSTAASRSRSI